MHEFGIAKALLDNLLESARANGISKITRVVLSCSELEADAESVKFAFEQVSQGSIAEGASLEIEIEPVKLRCRNCALLFDPDDSGRCPNCGNKTLEIVAPRGIELKCYEGVDAQD